MAEEERTGHPSPKGPTAIAAEVRRLRDATIAAAQKREFIPQPLFWSLFHTELKRLKSEREQIRAIEEALSRLG